jgi:hypothetical protein
LALTPAPAGGVYEIIKTIGEGADSGRLVLDGELKRRVQTK